MMSVTYSTNRMGPISLSWYRERGLLKEGSVEPTTYYGAGRIDIRGLDPEKYWSGWHEYSLPPMHIEDWNALSEWLVGLETTELWDYEMLISIFEGEALNGRKIRWMK